MKISRILTIMILIIVISGTSFAAGNYPQPAIYTRADWNARAPQCTFSDEATINRAIVHHTEATTDYETTAWTYTASRIRAHQNYHMDTLGWCDIGYHFLVDKLGNGAEGRERSLNGTPRGAHDGVNNLSMGFSCMGCFGYRSGQDQPTEPMIEKLCDMIAWKFPDPFTGYGSGPYGSKSDVGFIAAHRDVVSTSCPGDILYNDFIPPIWNGGEIRNRVYTKIISGAGPTPTPSPIPTPTPYVAPPDAPSNLSATAVSSTQINLTWSDNSSNETNFVIERKTSTTAYSVIATLGANITSYSNTGLKKNTTYTYRVKATNAGGSSGYSNEASAKTLK